MKTKVLATLFIVLSPFCMADTLSNVAIFQRCYRHLTQTVPNKTSALFQQVKSGSISPLNACESVLNKTSFTANSNNRLSNTNDDEALNVLRTFNYLHYSWFANKTFPPVSSNFGASKDFFDYTGPALYFTKSLFDSTHKISDVFKGKMHYESDRTDNDPSISPINERPKSEYPHFTVPFRFAAKGDLLGVREFTDKKFPHTGRNPSFTQFGGRLEFDLHWGGGILGSAIYLMLNMEEVSQTRFDGGRLVPRKWSRSVVHDFLCRDIPIIRLSDTTRYVDYNSQMSFRHNGACLKCHATIDQMAGVVRSAYLSATLFTTQPNTGVYRAAHMQDYHREFTPSAAQRNWTSNAEADYYRRAPTGRLFMRTTEGELILSELDNAQSLGDALADLDDPYICAAKRYYEYFTGISANVDDVSDPDYPMQLSNEDKQHRAEVIRLGKELKTHQNLKETIKSIMALPLYKESDYGL